MDKKLEQLLEKVGLDQNNFKYFEGGELIQIKGDTAKNYIISISLDLLLPVDIYRDLCLLVDEQYSMCSSVKLEISVNNQESILIIDYLKYFLSTYKDDLTGADKLIKKDNVDVIDNKIVVLLNDKIDVMKFKSIVNQLIADLNSVGIKDVLIEINDGSNSEIIVEELPDDDNVFSDPFAFVEDAKAMKAIIEDAKKAKEEAKKDIPKIAIDESVESNVIKGKKISGNITAIENILYEEENINLEAQIFGLEIRTTPKCHIITLKITDGTDSIYCKMFENNTDDNDVFPILKKNLKEGKWFRFNGYVKNDTWQKELVFFANSIETLERDEVKIVDDAEVKRVELHAHTFMSQMDGVVDAKKLVKQAHKWGHKAIAITDHNGAQAFPDVFKEVSWLNKDLVKEGKEPFKVIYGTELTLIEDNIKICIRENDSMLLENTYVVFDFETTGFNAGGGDSIIEVGAVKICNGEIIDKFSELIDPGVKIPKRITEITGISQAMVKGKRNEKEVITDFIKWYDDLPMVAHNAKFDISFLEMAYSKYGLGEFTNTVIDTLELSRALDSNFERHNLTALVKRYGVEWNEDAHHRADYDAEGTALVLHGMMKKLVSQNKEKVSDLNKLVADSEIYKYGRSYHVNILAKNRVGLKNMFKIISLANTKYFYKSARILRSEIMNLREGLLIGAGCDSSEVFIEARSKGEEELANIINFYDYVEVQPLENYSHLVLHGEIGSHEELVEHIKKIITVTEQTGKLIIATGDVHHMRREDKISRAIIVNQKVPGGGRHPLAKYGIENIPSKHFRTTNEMLECFDFLDKDLRNRLVLENPSKIADMCEIVDVIMDTKGVPFSPKIENSAQIVKDMVYKKAHDLYGKKIPELIVDRIEQELTGIIKGGYDVIYLISHKLVKKSNDDGYLVGSRGSVGSSVVAFLAGISEVNALPAHYVCPECKHSTFKDDNGEDLSKNYSTGYDLPDKNCSCGAAYNKEGQDIPFSSFLGFNADKVPDIDLNFSGEYQAIAHEYTKELFGIDNVFRAGTIGTVADKTAFGFVKGYCEYKGITLRTAEIERLAMGCTGVKRSTGQHPGGIVVIPDYMEVFDFTPYQYPADDTSSSWRTTHFDYHPMEEEILKLDILGHDDPTMLRMLQDLSGIDILTIKAFDDPKVLSLLSSPEVLGVTADEIGCKTGTLGVPELGTRYVIGMLEDIKPKTFGGLVKISGLSHGTGVWAGNAKDLIEQKTATFDDIIGCREELITKLMSYGMDGTNAFKITEFVRKSYAGRDSKMANPKWIPLKEELIKEEYNIPEWFIKSCETIEYMFPKAHATAYVMSALRIAWFKVYYPLYYYAAYFSVRCSAFEVETLLEGKDKIKERIQELITKFDAERTQKEVEILDVLYVCLEMACRGFSFKNIDMIKSDGKNFIIDEDGTGLIIPFRALDGLGGTVAQNIIDEREKRPFISIEDLQKRAKISSTLIEKMRFMGILDNMAESNQISIFDL